MYVETDFLVALAKQSDWLKEHALEALEEYDSLETSIVPFCELLFISDRFEFDRTRAVANLIELVDVKPDGDRQVLLKATGYQDDHGATTFDAVNAAIAEDRDLAVLSSDEIYEELDVDRVPLERRED